MHTTRTILAYCVLSVGAALTGIPAGAAADDQALKAATALLLEKDPDLQALGREQVRQGRNAAATSRFTALLPQLPPDGQAALVIALGDRGDTAALPEITKYLASDVPSLRAAAIRAVGALGGKDQAAVLVPLLGNSATEQDAQAAILCLRGPGVHAALLAGAADKAHLRAKLFPLLVTRYARDVLPELLAAAEDSDAGVRAAALAALGQLGGAEQVTDLARLIMKAPEGADRQKAEQALAILSSRLPNPDASAEPLLAFMKTQGVDEKAILLTALGRVGGKAARKIVLEAMKDREPLLREAGLQALCNWPDGTVAAELVKIATKGETPEQQTKALEALIRVAPLPNNRARPDTNRSDGERLAMVKKSMELATTEAQKSRILRRASAVYTFDCFKFVLPYLDQPEYAEAAAETIVSIAHHKEVRHAHPAEFAEALERIIRTSKNPKLINEATRYKEDRT